MSREEKIKILHETYGSKNEYVWSLAELNKRNDAQIDMLYNACLDENSQLRKKSES